jgi:hypothetical protein
MVLSRGLMISLSISALGCTILFLYFRNKISSVEKKVDVMFDLIQNHQQEQYNIPESIQQEVEQHNNTGYDNSNNFEENVQTNFEENVQTNFEENVQTNLISISDDDDDDDDDDDSEEVSDSDEDITDNEELPKISIEQTENMTLEVNDIKKITVQETDKVNTEESNQVREIEDVTDSLDEVDDSDDEETDTEIPLKNDTVENSLIDNIFDYNKLKVSELKSLAKQKGLQNYKSLKKGPLVDLLKSFE